MMKGSLEKTGNKWFVRYDVNDNVFRLPLHPNFVEMTDFVYIRGDRFYDGYEIEFTEVLVNPMGRDVDSKNLSQNHTLCKWYARPYLGEKEDLVMEVPMAQYLKEEPKQETRELNPYIGSFLLRNGFKGIGGDSYSNSECTIIVTEDHYEIQFMEEGLEVSMYTDSLSIYHLVGILTWFNLIDKNYKK